jgi:hypothetical protein
LVEAVAMPIPALGLLSKASSKLLLEVVPVAAASVIGTIVINHYGRQPAPPIVVQAAPPTAQAEELFQTLRDDHELIADYLKHKQDEAARRAASEPILLASAESTPPVAEVHRAEPRLAAAAKIAARPAVKPPVKKKPASDPPTVLLDPPLAYEPPPAAADSAIVAAPVEPLARPRPILDVASAMRDWVVDVAQFSQRALVLRRFYDPAPAPSSAPVRGSDLLQPD